ncbi:hypothetical protein [Aliivibrio kagoshimensis]|uniref:hypothetical protein n=1 Tax=Aliivibrio kagoshimensis TaxID=2910230 RepID=UPI003D0A339E
MIHSAKGLQLFELTQGMPLSSPILYSDLGMSTEHDVEVRFNQEGDLIVHYLDQTFTRKSPGLMIDATALSSLTAREGRYAQQIIEMLPVHQLQMKKALKGTDNAL